MPIQQWNNLNYSAQSVAGMRGNHCELARFGVQAISEGKLRIALVYQVLQQPAYIFRRTIRTYCELRPECAAFGHEHFSRRVRRAGDLGCNIGHVVFVNVRRILNTNRNAELFTERYGCGIQWSSTIDCQDAAVTVTL